MDYKNGKIYVIRSHQTDQVYIGSTTQSLAKRFSCHKSNYKINKLDISSFEILKYDDAYIELIEEYPCDNKMMLNRREGEIIRQNNCVNKFIAGRTRQEYEEENKDKIKEQKKEYRENNKDKKKKKNRIYEEENKDKIREQKKGYYQANKDKKKEYYQANKDKNNVVIL